MFFRLAEGVRTAPLGESWASFSALSGETMLLNAEAASILELLSNGPAHEAQVADSLASDTGTDVAQVREALRHVWDQLVSAGLVEHVERSEHNPG